MMNWEAIGAIAETLGALAVIATLFYLAVQIRQNNRNVEENIRRLRLDAGVSTIESFSRYRAYLCQADLAAIHLKGMADYTALSDVERVRFGSVMDELLYSYSTLMLRVQENTYDRANWRQHMVGLKLQLGQAGAAEWWRRSQVKFPHALVAEINRSND